MKEYIPGLAGVPATKSAISSIDGEKGILAYRGYSIDDLVAHSSFEETALLLMQGELPTPKELEAFEDLYKSATRLKAKSAPCYGRFLKKATQWMYFKLQ